MKKIITSAFMCLLTLPLWANSNTVNEIDSSLAKSNYNVHFGEPFSLRFPSSVRTSSTFGDFILDEGESIGYSFSTTYQLRFDVYYWSEFFYTGIEFGFNLDHKEYASNRSTQPLYNPFSFNTYSLGFKIGPLMLGCNIGYNWDIKKVHWLYNFGPLPGLVASGFGKILDASETFFDGVYFMWGPEVHLQLWNVMLTGGYQIFPSLDMNCVYIGIGINYGD